ncbi:hypothetical protein [Sporosarcina sp. HYO08]|uniref:hypothetical protein n=1 Tax=Sporosarcina sp. HYO08 TaxID=1759557 RepID=UPI0007995B0D|nr:hypothetical protein [Sporosarcina sp. HYO08]KXH87526.1 hypothetical protein AU377_02870 [Sporosarcina sp. HYO08]
MIYLNKFILLILMCTVIGGAYYGKVHANSKFQPRTIEESYLEIGYKPVGEALRDFEHHYKQNLQLPLRVSPVIFTHVFARFNEGDGKDIFEMEFINEQSPKNNFMINVAVKDSFKILDKEVTKEFRLKGGNTAYLLSTGGTILLVFEKDNLQYRFSVDKRMSEKITPETLVRIANSIDY